MTLAHSIQGSLGEALVAELFRQNGWVVRHFGVEHHLPVVPGSSQAFAAMPDLLVARPGKEDAQALFVEVKTGGRPTLADAQAYANYGTILLVHVGPTGIDAAWFFGRRHRGELRFEPIQERRSLELGRVEEFHAAARHLLGMMARVGAATPGDRMVAMVQ